MISFLDLVNFARTTSLANSNILLTHKSSQVDNILSMRIRITYFLRNTADANACRQSSPCKNGATCTSTGVSTYSCTCTTGYAGTNCDEGKLNYCKAIGRNLSYRGLCTTILISSIR